jgi:type 1 glutamine amidotransferase
VISLALALLVPLGPLTTEDLGVVDLASGDSAPRFAVLVFSRTTGYRHSSIPVGVQALGHLGRAHGFAVAATEDASAFTSENLARYCVVIWLSTSGDVLDDGQRSAFEAYIREGGGYVGVHGAADTEYGWAWYGGLVGAYFRSHPAPQTATLTVRDGQHPSTAHLDAAWTRFDEWYDFRSLPGREITVLLTLEEATYRGGGMGAYHPIAWCHEYQGGRAFYTGCGHTAESFGEPAFRQHLLGAIRWAAGL